MEVDWASLHKILSDTTRRSILGVLAEREALGYTEMMTLLQITNTGRLNYHLKALGNLISKDDSGKYHLTEQGRQAASLLKTFPERVPPERKLSALKAITAVGLILIGVIIIASFAILLVSAPGPSSVGIDHASLGPQLIPQNTTIYLTGWTLSSPVFGISWSAAGPLHIYVLNQTQYDALLLSHSTGAQNSLVPYNFTGPPESWVQQYNQPSGNVSVSLPQGQYHFYAWSQTTTLLDSFSLAQTQTSPKGTPLSPFLLFYASLFMAIGALLIALAVLILTRRVWR